MAEEVGVVEDEALRFVPLERAHARAAGGLLSASHADYPAFRHVYPAPDTRRRALLPFMTASAADAAAIGARTVSISPLSRRNKGQRRSKHLVPASC